MVEGHSPGQHPEEDDTLMSSSFSEGVVRRRRLVVTLQGTEDNLSSLAFQVILASERETAHNVGKLQVQRVRACLLLNYTVISGHRRPRSIKPNWYSMPGVVCLPAGALRKP